jgi:hypothetical protein
MDITITLNNTIFCSINSYKDTLYKSRTDSTQKITETNKLSTKKLCKIFKKKIHVGLWETENNLISTFMPMSSEIGG